MIAAWELVRDAEGCDAEERARVTITRGPGVNTLLRACSLGLVWGFLYYGQSPPALGGVLPLHTQVPAALQCPWSDEIVGSALHV